MAGADFTKGYVSQLETGRVGLSLRAAQVFATRLGVSVADLTEVPNDADHLAELTVLEAERELAEGSPKRALELSQSIVSSVRLKGRVLRLRGRSQLALDQAKEAVSTLEKALEAFRVEGDHEGRIRTQHDLAYAHARLDRPEQAIVLLLQCAHALKSGDLVDRQFELGIESFLAATYARIGDSASAEAHIERAKALAEDVLDHDALAALYGQLAGTEQQRGRYEQAVGMWRRCLRELDLAGRERLVGDAWHNLATAYLRLGEHAQARQALSRSEEMQRETGHVRLGAWIRLTRAKLALEERRYPEAEALASDASRDKGATPLARGEALLVLAQLLVRKRATAGKVRAAFDAALTEMKDEPIGSRVRALKLYADGLAAVGEIEDAFKRSREALELVRPGR